ncbi:MAG: hypothetical protein ABSE63_17245 [Thermoguttaceae bacterium]|jgi:hypothetical protein
MMNDNDVEKILLNVPRSHVTAGSHRSDLKAKLLQTSQNERPIMKTKKWKLAIAACCTILLLAALGFAAQQIYFKFFIVEQSAEPEVIKTVLPNGTEKVTYWGSATAIASDDPNFTQEKADQQWQETKRAISRGKYKLFKVDESTDPPAYYYSVQLEDGRTVGYGTNLPLPEPQQESPDGE